MDSFSDYRLRRWLPDLPLALASIGGFWLFYFATVVVRTLVINEDAVWLGYRALGCLVGAALTFLVYVVLSRAARDSIKIQIIAAAIACLPAAAMFSTFNLAFALQQPLVARTIIQERAGEGRTVRTERVPEREGPAGTGAPGMRSGAERLASLPPMVRRRIADGLITWYFFFAAWASFYIAISSAARLRTAERRAAAAERDVHEAQLRALRYQVNPHFLFNTLNSLSSLVLARREEEAEAMIHNLSTFFRQSLTLDPSDDVRLAQEIEFQKLYLDIEKVRFPNRLKVAIDIPPHLEAARVPPLILQPLVENAIKHGVARTAKPVTLTVAAREVDEQLVLTVENDGNGGGGAGEEHGTGVGLVNVCERLHARFGGEALCEHSPLPDGGYRVTLTMPLEME